MSDTAGGAAHEAARDAFEHAITDPPTRVVVIGGGAAGLVAAREIARPGFDVTVLEERPTLGGSVARHEVAGITLDAGAESFATRGGHVAALIDDLGLTEAVVTPLAAGAWLQLPGRAVPTPKAGMLGIPSSPLASDVIAAIGWGGALRAYLDRLMPVLKIGEERNLGRLVRRRMGAAVLDELVAPVTTGVYSASPYDLDVAVAAPGLNQALTRTGSLSGAVAALRESAKAGSAVGGLIGGMARLIDVLAADATARGALLRTGVDVVGLAPSDTAGDVLAASVDQVFGDPAPDDAAPDGGEKPARSEVESARPAPWRVTLADGESIDADAVLLAVPSDAALRLLGQASATLEPLAGLGWPAASTVDIVTLVIDDARLDTAPRGTGMLVAETVPASEVSAKAMTHVTAKWPWVAQQLPAGRHVLRLSYGRAGSPSPLEGLDGPAVRLRAVADASTLLNIPLAESNVVASDVVRWTNALPVAAEGERERIGAVRDAVDRVDGLEVTGSWLTGTGLASVVPDARKAAERVRALRWKTLTDTAGTDADGPGEDATDKN
ncbi:NAD(P)-binding protein [Planctomonas sp. JC2975]|uniref:protoporphyrinogen/coproporphyrinogen oxidase n=1 Tax=Planctomonas sp. JC2975 TaxID=2729626 RepID=UPI001473C865|nr:FAD-dependent oxidoreductase [Planctomonas sp. JC2975]NNC12674.1 NAD(P)-binding protein [Planctomonas sp. JC2975]